MTFPPNSPALYRDKPVIVSCYTPDGVQIEQDGELLTVSESELLPTGLAAPLPEFAVSKRQREMATILVANNAGGVGKTSLTIALAHLLTTWGLRVAVLDFDPQANATTFSGITRAISPEETFHQVVADPSAPLPPLLPAHGYDLLPSSNVLRQTARTLAKSERWHLLRDRLPGLTGQYDLVFVDCGPSLDPLAMAGGMAADFVLTPSSTSVKGIGGFEGVAGFVQEVRELGNPDLSICLFVPTLHQKRTKAEAQAYEEMVAGIPAHLLATPIMRAQKWVDAAAEGKPVTAFKGVPTQQVERLAAELIRSIGWEDEVEA